MANIIFIITKTIDFFAVLIISISAIQTIIPIIISLSKTNRKEDNYNNRDSIAIKSFINSLLLALELESANAILKMGLFISNATASTVDSSSSIFQSDNSNNFIFFVAVLSVRIAINQTLKRYNINRKINKYWYLYCPRSNILAIF